MVVNESTVLRCGKFCSRARVKWQQKISKKLRLAGDDQGAMRMTQHPDAVPVLGRDVLVWVRLWSKTVKVMGLNHVC